MLIRSKGPKNGKIYFCRMKMKEKMIFLRDVSDIGSEKCYKNNRVL